MGIVAVLLDDLAAMAEAAEYRRIWWQTITHIHAYTNRRHCWSSLASSPNDSNGNIYIIWFKHFDAQTRLFKVFVITSKHIFLKVFNEALTYPPFREVGILQPTTRKLFLTSTISLDFILPFILDCLTVNASLKNYFAMPTLNRTSYSFPCPTLPRSGNCTIVRPQSDI